MAEEQDRDTTPHTHTNSSKDHLNAEQTPQNNFWMLARGHQAPRKAAHSLQKEVGQNITAKRETKELGVETCPGEGVMKEKFPHSRKPSHWWVCGEFWNLREQHNWEGKKKTTEYTPNLNSQQRSSPEAGIYHQRAGAGWGGTGCIISAQGKDQA